MKEIHFYYDNPDHYDLGEVRYICLTYEDTKRFIGWGVKNIHTTSLSNLNFDLLDKDYKIYLHQNNKILEAKPGMIGAHREIRRSHNILKMWLAGAFHNYFYSKN